MTWSSPEAFVKQLRSSNDVELAISAWADEDLYIPSKGQFIVSWALNQLLKNKQSRQNERLWDLLRSILLPRDALPPWLSTVLSKTPVVPIVTALLHDFANGDEGVESGNEMGSRELVLREILPLVYPRTRLETALECFWAALEVLVQQKAINSISTLVELSIEGFKYAFNKAANKGKVYSEFLKEHLTQWIMAYHAALDHPALRQQLWTAANGILCSLDALKVVLRPPTEGQEDLFERLRVTCQPYPPTYGILSQLFRDLLHAAITHKASLTQLGIEVSFPQLYTSFASICNSGGDESIGAILELIRVVEREVGNPSQDLKWDSILRATTQWCVDQTSSSADDSRKLDILFNMLTTLGRMDYAFILPHTGAILALMASIDGANGPCSRLQEVMILYHSKTRTMDQLCHQIISVVPTIAASNSGSAAVTREDIPRPERILDGCLLGVLAGASLSAAVARYITPGQLLQVARAIISASSQQVTDILESTNEANGAQNGNCLFEDAFATSCYMLRLATFVIPALTMATLPPSSQEELLGFSETLHNKVIVPSLNICLNKSNLSLHGCHLLGSSALRLVSCIADNCAWIRPHNPFDNDLRRCSEDILASPDYPSQLKIELARALILYSSTKELVTTFDLVLNQLKTTGTWDGKITTMDDDALSTAYWSMLTGEWFNAFARQAGQVQLEQFAALIVAAYAPTHSKFNAALVTPATLVGRLLQNGSFWEQERVQGAILTKLLNMTSQLDLVQYQDSDRGGTMQRLAISELNIQALGRCFHILLYFPSETLGSSNAPLLARRAILLDIYMCGLDENHAPTETWIRSALRTFASRRLHDDSPAFRKFVADREIVTFLCTSEVDGMQDAYLEKSLHAATKAILEVVFPIFLTEKRPESLILEDIKHLVASSDHLGVILSSKITLYQLEWWSCLLYAINNWANSTSLSDDTIHLIQDTVSKLHAIVGDFTVHIQPHMYHKLPSVLGLLRSCLSVGRTLNTIDTKGTIELCVNTTLPVLRAFQGKQEDWKHLFQELQWLLFDEVQNGPDALSALQRMLAVYLMANPEWDSDSSIDTPLRHAVRSLRIDDYQSIMAVVHEAMTEKGASNLAKLVHISTLMLKDTPEGTSRAAQAALTNNLLCFKQLPISWERHSFDACREILLQTLYICQDKPALLQSYDAGSVFTLLARMSQSSIDSGTSTHPEIFHSIVKTASALIRNRRDLVIHLLPHLVCILCDLLGHFRAAKPNLGQKQRRAISNQLPPWITLSHPLGLQEATAMARLLVTLTSKTIVRSKSNPGAAMHDGHDVQSIAKPFGKHASCVLGAYIEIANDPLCLLGRDVRMELMPGLHALCGMSGEKGRDALIPMLDGGGKMVLKMLWSSYEKQRYSGQG